MATAPTPEMLSALARHVRLRRRALGMSIEDAAESVSMSPVTWGRVEKGLPVRSLTHSGVERALQWRPGSVETVLVGGEPELDDDPRPLAPPAVMDDPLVVRILASPLPDEDKADLIHMVLKDRRRAEEVATERVQERITAWERWQARKGA